MVDVPHAGLSGHSGPNMLVWHEPLQVSSWFLLSSPFQKAHEPLFEKPAHKPSLLPALRHPFVSPSPGSARLGSARLGSARASAGGVHLAQLPLLLRAPVAARLRGLGLRDRVALRAEGPNWRLGVRWSPEPGGKTGEENPSKAGKMVGGWGGLEKGVGGGIGDSQGLGLCFLQGIPESPVAFFLGTVTDAR